MRDEESVRNGWGNWLTGSIYGFWEVKRFSVYNYGVLMWEGYLLYFIFWVGVVIYFFSFSV